LLEVGWIVLFQIFLHKLTLRFAIKENQITSKFKFFKKMQNMTPSKAMLSCVVRIKTVINKRNYVSNSHFATLNDARKGRVHRRVEDVSLL
jgi:hypothetical protein